MKRTVLHRGLPLCPGDLAGLDVFNAEAVVVFCFEDVRPLPGVAGFFDWRLCGALSRVLADGQFRGAADEVMMMPVDGRLGQRRLFLFGLGTSRDASPQRLQAACQNALAIVRRAGVDRLALAAVPVPGEPQPEGTFLEAARLATESQPGLVAEILVERVT